MSASTKSNRDTPTHPKDGAIIVTTLPDSNAATIDCSSLHSKRCMVQIVNESSSDVLYYKFAKANNTAISSSTACQLMQNEMSEKAFIPQGHPYLRVIGANGTIVRVWQASETIR